MSPYKTCWTRVSVRTAGLMITPWARYWSPEMRNRFEPVSPGLPWAPFHIDPVMHTSIGGDQEHGVCLSTRHRLPNCRIPTVAFPPQQQYWLLSSPKTMQLESLSVAFLHRAVELEYKFALQLLVSPQSNSLAFLPLDIRTATTSEGNCCKLVSLEALSSLLRSVSACCSVMSANT